MTEPQDNTERGGNPGRKRRGILRAGVAAVVLPLLLIGGASLVYERRGGGACASCHEIWQPYTDWKTSAHRNLQCRECHGDVFTVDAGFHVKNMRRVITHLEGDAPEQPRLKTKDVTAMVARCEKCHQEEFADWRASGHGATYEQIFLNKEHNAREVLMDDCLRCHGMHFDGPMQELVAPLNTTGPWQMRNVAMTTDPVMPCLTCHQIHHQGAVLEKLSASQKKPSGAEEFHRPSLGFFDRRELRHVALSGLPLPKMVDGERAVSISPDVRQALCYQCHAPLANRQVGSGDDRTPVGVHEGLSCLACHQKHGERTRASCATCHPKLSNCGIDVEKMDTTFKDRASKHNIHFVQCKDCHPKGIPHKRADVQHGVLR